MFSILIILSGNGYVFPHRDEDPDEPAAAGPTANFLRAPATPQSLAEMGMSPLDIIMLSALADNPELRKRHLHECLRCPSSLLEQPIFREEPRHPTLPTHP